MTEASVAGHTAIVGPLPLFEDVYAEHVDVVWRILRRLGVPPSDLEDSVQEVFIRAHRQLPGFEGRSSVKTWICGIATFVARERARAQQRHPERRVADEEVIELADGRPGPDDLAARGEALEMLGRLLEALDPEKREVFVLARIEELSGPEIAAALGIKLNTAYSRLRLAEAEIERALTRHHEAQR